ncbi:hypothetical protein FB558_5728 [Pseudonocardia kunmingensis]|uniref:Uncharacterized protein n=1 Tax=Pseudonocardia kunmingensis TaxID=630975 RepID=A0A543DKT3_9PSEU|nr:hypothetical protein FB558_5728 [Pseudonocardia kunmingensis]
MTMAGAFSVLPTGLTGMRSCDVRSAGLRLPPWAAARVRVR